jgi:hypothetical protein
MTAVTETAPVSYRVLGLERVYGHGRLLALAIVEIEVGGIPITLQGCRICRKPGGGLEVTAPYFRAPNAVWRSCIVLPPELADALGAEIMAAVEPLRLAVA